MILWLIVGLAYWYHCKYRVGHWRESPTLGIQVVEVATEGAGPAQLNDFRKRTVRQVLDPLEKELAKIKELRLQTKRGTVRPPDFSERAQKIRNKLLATMTDARLRRVPKRYWKKYKLTIEAIGLASQSLIELEESMEHETVGVRERLYKSSLKKWKRAYVSIKFSRDYFRHPDRVSEFADRAKLQDSPPNERESSRL